MVNKTKTTVRTADKSILIIPDDIIATTGHGGSSSWLIHFIIFQYEKTQESTNDLSRSFIGLDSFIKIVLPTTI